MVDVVPCILNIDGGSGVGIDMVSFIAIWSRIILLTKGAPRDILEAKLQQSRSIQRRCS